MLGTYLLLGDDLFDDKLGRRIINLPKRHRVSPVITNTTHHNANFSCSVYRFGGFYHAWFLASTDVTDPTKLYTAYSKSADGYRWQVPWQVLTGKAFSDILYDPQAPAHERFKGYRGLDGPPPRWYGELVTSPDGLAWTSRGQVTAERYGETWQPFRLDDGRYGLLHRMNIRDYGWFDAEGVYHRNTIHDRTFVRCIGVTVSANPASFPTSTLTFAPGDKDSGETQFYAVSQVVRRGQYYIAFLSVLRDDLVAADAPPGSYGTGYSELIFSLDGFHWQRTYQPFFSPQPGKWDGAVTWIDSIVSLQGSHRLYYGGYRWGHKNYKDRQIGALSLPKDRFGGFEGIFRTHLFENKANRLALNLDGRNWPVGTVVRVIDANGNTRRTSPAMFENSVNRVVSLDLSAFRNQAIALEVEGGPIYSLRLYS